MTIIKDFQHALEFQNLLLEDHAMLKPTTLNVLNKEEHQDATVTQLKESEKKNCLFDFVYKHFQNSKT